MSLQKWDSICVLWSPPMFLQRIFTSNLMDRICQSFHSIHLQTSIWFSLCHWLGPSGPSRTKNDEIALNEISLKQTFLIFSNKPCNFIFNPIHSSCIIAQGKESASQIISFHWKWKNLSFIGIKGNTFDKSQKLWLNSSFVNIFETFGLIWCFYDFLCALTCLPEVKPLKHNGAV